MKKESWFIRKAGSPCLCKPYHTDHRTLVLVRNTCPEHGPRETLLDKYRQKLLESRATSLGGIYVGK